MKWDELEMEDGRVRYETVLFGSVEITLWTQSAIGFEYWNISVTCFDCFCGHQIFKEKSRDSDKAKAKAISIAKTIISKKSKSLFALAGKMEGIAEKLNDHIKGGKK